MEKSTGKERDRKEGLPFSRFLFSGALRMEWITLPLLAIAVYGLLLYVYPFPNFYSDTGAYITAAGNGHSGIFRPIGYSWLLAAAHAITPDPDILVLLQTVLYFGATFLLYATLRFYYGTVPARAWRIFFFPFLLAPTCLYLCNFAISDILFISLTNLWLATLVALLYRASAMTVFFNGVLLVLLLQTRYISLFYPAITVGVLFVSLFRRHKGRFLALSLLQAALFFASIGYTKRGTERYTGAAVFTGFSGWQKANNALHILPHVGDRPALPADPEVRLVDSIVRRHFGPAMYPKKDSVVVSYLWSNESPLKRYLFLKKGNGRRPYLYYWHRAGEPLGKWADFIIRQYPGAFVRYYLRPNAGLLFALPNESLFVFSKPPQQIRKWFGCEHCAYKPRYAGIHRFLERTASAGINVLWAFFFLSLPFLFARTFRKAPFEQQAIAGTLILFCIAYAALSVYASPLVLRYLLVIRHSMVLVPFLLIGSWWAGRTHTATDRVENS